jgi:hypothetical protein
MHKVQIALDGALAGLMVANCVLNAMNGNSITVYCLCAVCIMQCVKSILQLQTIRRERECSDWALRMLLRFMGIQAKEHSQK